MKRIILVIILTAKYIYCADSFNIHGRVLDLADQAVSNVFVTANNYTCTTNNSGYYDLVIPGSSLPLQKSADKTTKYKNYNISIYNLLGQRVFEEIFSSHYIQNYNWNGIDMHGRELSSGIYFIIVEVDGNILIKSKLSIINGRVINPNPFFSLKNPKILSKFSQYSLMLTVQGEHIKNIINQTVTIDVNDDLSFGQAENLYVNRFPEANFIFQSTENAHEYIFDASQSHDDDNQIRYRWDWGNDGEWDTNFLFSPIQLYKFKHPGKFKTKLQVCDNIGQMNDKTYTIDIPCTPPIAIYTLSADSGYFRNEFIFDASSSYDNEEGSNNLLVRWDFESDGYWDTNFSEEKTIGHIFDTVGTNYTTMQVMDSDGLLSEMVRPVIINYIYDDFDTLLDRWIIQIYGFPGNGSNMVEDNVYINSSMLNLDLTINEDIMLPMPYNAGEVGDTTFFEFGYFETRIKPNVVEGSVGSFFLMNRFEMTNWEHKEIDIEFLGNNLTSIQMTTHDYQDGGTNHMYSDSTMDLGFDIRDDFHNYGILWTPDSVSWFIDGDFFHTETLYVPQVPLSIHLNNWACDESVDGMVDWLGEVDESNLPSSMQYEWIKVIPLEIYMNSK